MKRNVTKALSCCLALSMALALVPAAAMAADEPQDEATVIQDVASDEESTEVEAVEAEDPAEVEAEDSAEALAEADDPAEAAEPAEVPVEAEPEAAAQDEGPSEPKEADGWRFQDGTRVSQESVETSDDQDDEGLVLEAMAGFVMWEKDSKGRYISSNGKPILGVVARGVDVSEWNGKVNWEVAKENDVSFAIIRVGGRFMTSRKLYGDEQYKRNTSECERLGIPYGVYFFSTALTAKEAQEEAKYTIAQLKGLDPSMPVYLDLEWDHFDELYYEKGAATVRKTLAEVSKAFCAEIEKAGYQPGVYASTSWWENYLTDTCFDAWPKWVAQYYSRCEYQGNYQMWQCTGVGSIKGFEDGSDGVDINFYYGEDGWANPAETKAWTRLWGQNAFGTMEAISQEGWSDGSSKSVVVATSDGYWDALSASALAGKLGCPVLMTQKGELNAFTALEIKRLGATTAYVVGGTAAVSADVDAQLKAAGVVTVKRVWGQNAAGTARAVAAELGSGHAKTCFVATWTGYWDALSASPVSYAKGMPIFLTEGSANTLSQDTLDAITKGGYTSVVVAGGTAAVPSSVDDQLEGIGVSVTRCWGKTAHETSVALANYGLEQGLSAKGMGVATSGGYWDALTGAALCGKRESVLVLVSDTNLAAIDDFVAKHAKDVSQGVVLGGTAAVPTGIWDELAGVTG